MKDFNHIIILLVDTGIEINMKNSLTYLLIFIGFVFIFLAAISVVHSLQIKNYNQKVFCENANGFITQDLYTGDDVCIKK